MSKMLRIPMQFFAEPTGTEGDTGSQGAEGTNPGDQNQSQNSGATFSQADLNRIGAQEKANGKKSILKELGFEDEKSAKEAITKYNEWIASQKTEAEKQQEKLNAATSAQTAAEARAVLAENKLEILKAGGNAASVDDIMAMVSVRVNDKTDFKAALEDVKKAYPNFFGSSGNSDTGTGGSLNRQKQGSGNAPEGIGERLAKSKIKNNSTKNPYFND